MRNRARGFSLISIIAVVMLAVTASTLALVLLRSRSSVEALGETAAQFDEIEKALVTYAAQNKRLPCPASGTAGTGVAEPSTATTNATPCTSATGVVPWTTLGLSREAITDPWGGLISYRVYSGATGLTQADGASLIDCDTNEELPRSVTSSGGCRSTKDTRPASWFIGKGLSITDNATTYTDAAWVLISHGPTGRGGFSNGFLARSAPTVGGDEASNITIAGPFVRTAASSPGTDPASTSHFDDLVAYLRLPDLISKSGNGARDWPDDLLDTRLRFTLDANTVSTAVGSTFVTGQNIGQSNISLDGGNAVIQAFSTDTTSPSTSYIGIRTSNGVEGIGIGGTSNIVAGSEYLEITFNNSTLRKFGITLNEFGSGVLSGTPYQERVQITFLNGNATVDTVIKFSCAPSNPLASFDITAAADFNKVRVEPLSAQPAVGLSSFLISAIRACPVTSPSCGTTLATSFPLSVCP